MMVNSIDSNYCSHPLTPRILFVSCWQNANLFCIVLQNYFFQTPTKETKFVQEAEPKTPTALGTPMRRPKLFRGLTSGTSMKRNLGDKKKGKRGDSNFTPENTFTAVTPQTPTVPTSATQDEPNYMGM